MVQTTYLMGVVSSKVAAMAMAKCTRFCAETTARLSASRAKKDFDLYLKPKT